MSHLETHKLAAKTDKIYKYAKVSLGTLAYIKTKKTKSYTINNTEQSEAVNI